MSRIRHSIAFAMLSVMIVLTGCGTNNTRSVGAPNPLSTPRQWTWWSGSSTANATGTYGTEGSTSEANTPGARVSGASWTDMTGNLWLFGGDGIDSTGNGGLLNDLWEFNVQSRTWTWQGGSNVATGLPSYGALGVASSSNLPGGRQNALTWKDRNGNFWLFGGQGLDATGAVGLLNDLWQFDSTTRMWTWMGGSDIAGASGVYGSVNVADSTSVPGARDLAVGWTDPSGMFWLFGGQGVDSAGTAGLLNDLWRFDPVANQWTWMSGSTIEGSIGVYGTLAQTTANSIPGARMRSVGWLDSKGNLWLFGGDGYDSTLLPLGPPQGQPHGLLNDLWEFNVATGTWIWMSGSDLKNAKSSYGTLGVAAASNVPGARAGALAWSDTSGNFWMFGGNYLNDLWQFDTNTLQWTWMNGNNVAAAPGVYGTVGIAIVTNQPGARQSGIEWTDSSGNFWLLGGQGYDVSGTNNPLVIPTPGILNDLWVYHP